MDIQGYIKTSRGSGGALLLRIARVSLFALLIAFGAFQPAWADSVAIRAGERGGGARIVFQWPAAVGFTSSQSGNKVVLRFERPLEGEVSSLTSRLGDWVKTARSSNGGRMLELVLAKPAQPRSFASGSRIVLDLLPAQARPVATSPTPAVPAKPQAQTRTPAAPKAANVRIGHHATFDRAVLDLGGAGRVTRSANTLTVTTRTSRRLTDAQLGLLKLPQVEKVEQSVSNGQLVLRFALKAGATVRNFSMPGGVGLDFSGGAPVAAAAATPVPAAPAAVVVPPVEPQAEPAAAVVSTAPPVQTPVETVEAPTPQQQMIEAPAPHAQPVAHIAVTALPADVLPPLDMHVAKDTALAVFRRGTSIFIALPDKNTPSDLSSLVGAALATDPHAQLVPAQGGRVIRLLVGSGRVSPVIEAIETGWRIHFSDSDPPAVTELPVEVQPDYALGPRILLRTEKAGNPVTFVDPVIGDTLITVPVAPARLGVGHGRSLVQAELLPSAQGVAVRPLADTLSVLSTNAGIEISASKGLLLAEKLTSEQAEAGTGETAAMEAPPIPVLPPLLDFSSLGVPAGDKFIATRQELQKAIAEAAPDDRDLRRIDLARFYFINGMPSEAAAIWSMVSASKPEYADRPEVVLYRAIASFSNGTIDKIKARVTALTQPTTDSALWRAMLAVRERDWTSASEQFRQSMSRIGDYPDPYRTRLELALIETALQTQDYVMAEGALNRLSDRQRLVTRRLSPAAEYLTGALNWQEEKPDEARARFSSAAASRNQLWHVRAELALIEADIKENRIDAAEAVKRLERLRFAWRGDALEYDIVYRLAGLRLQNGDFASAFEDYSKLAEKFSADPRTPGLAEEQRTAFTRIFEGDTRDKTPAYSQLAIWDRYPQFRPVDEVKLDDIKLYLAERAASIDLLDRAAGFVSDVLTRVEDPVARAKMGTQLSGIFLLDGKPQEAIKALADTADQAAQIPESLRDERRILQARSLFGQNKPDDALALLANDYTDPATRLRADITWQTKRWPESAAALDALIGPPPPDGQKLADGLSPLVVNRATALVLADDTEGLTALRVKFGAAMATTPEAATFQLLTRADNAGGLENKLSVMRRVSEVDLFKKFLERYRGQGGETAPTASASVTPPSVPQGQDAAAH